MISSRRDRPSVIKVLTIVTLLGMILARLVWAEARSAPIELSPRLLSWAALEGRSQICGVSVPAIELDVRSPWAGESLQGKATRSPPWRPKAWPLWADALCPIIGAQSTMGPEPLPSSGLGKNEGVLRWNQGVHVATVLALTLATRIALSSWIAAVLTALILMSRGSFIAESSVAGGASLGMLACAIWICCIVHTLRTRTALGLWLATGSMGIAALLEPAFSMMLPVLPFCFLFLPKLQPGPGQAPGNPTSWLMPANQLSREDSQALNRNLRSTAILSFAGTASVVIFFYAAQVGAAAASGLRLELRNLVAQDPLHISTLEVFWQTAHARGAEAFRTLLATKDPIDIHWLASASAIIAGGVWVGHKNGSVVPQSCRLMATMVLLLLAGGLFLDLLDFAWLVGTSSDGLRNVLATYSVFSLPPPLTGLPGVPGSGGIALREVLRWSEPVVLTGGVWAAWYLAQTLWRSAVRIR